MGVDMRVNSDSRVAAWRVVGPATALAVLLAIGYLLLPRMGTDLSAQVAHADFFARFGTTPVDLRWYGGSEQFGYSLVSPAVMALLGVRLTGALALVASSALFALLLARTGVPRPLLGALVGALCIAGNLVSGRVTYALGVAFGLAALALLTYRDRRLAWWTAGVAALLASATSPVAGLFVGLVGAAILVVDLFRAYRQRRDLPARRTDGDARWPDGVLLIVAAAVPLLMTTVLFGEGGWMNTGTTDTVHAVITSLVVAALVPRPVVRFGALFSALGVATAALVHTPVGLNATRLAVMFALPVLASSATLPAAVTSRLPLRGRLAGAAGLVVLLGVGYWWQPPWLVNDFRDRGTPSSERSYFTPLLAQLGDRAATGRIEVPPTRDYWEAAYLDGYPLARGWLRQVDIARNPLFFTEIPGDSGTGVPLTADSYHAWLQRNAVQFVAIPDAPLSWVGRPEAALVAAGLPYLTQVWTGQHWRLYAVTDPTPIIAAPATLVSQDAAHLTFDAPAPGDYDLRLRYSRWLTVSGPTGEADDKSATLERQGDWARVHVARAGRYTVGSSLTR